MAVPRPLKHGKLAVTCSPARLGFSTTSELTPPERFTEQARAREALDFGISMQRDGYHIFAMGSSGSSKHRLVRQFLERNRLPQGEIRDWVYVHNFEQDHQPRALSFPPGHGVKFEESMIQLVEDLSAAIPAAFESDEYRARLHAVEEKYSEQEQKAFQDLNERGTKEGVSLIRTTGGLALAPVENGEVMEPEAFEKLPEDRKEVIKEVVTRLQAELQEIMQQVPKIRRELRQQVRALERELARSIAQGLIDEIRRPHKDLAPVMSYLDEVLADVIERARDFVPDQGGDEEAQNNPLAILAAGKEASFQRYQVNVLVSNEESRVPIVFEDHPTFVNLVGRIEHEAEMGNLVTNFTLIMAGALHKANGGYLILNIDDVLTHPQAYEGLKRALRNQTIQTESLGKAVNLINTRSLEPEPIPLDIKVVLVGERQYFYSLQRYDPDFLELFKVHADFDESLPRTLKNEKFFARILAGVIDDRGLCPFDGKSIARVIEHASRLADSSDKISLHFESITDLLQEADYYAVKSKAKKVGEKHVYQALDAQEERSGRIPDLLLERHCDGTILVNTTGEAVGQVNGLSVIRIGGRTVGQPHRITSRTRQGNGRVVDIERESQLGGSIHSKGVFILSSYLSATFLPEKPLSLEASLVFEQSYNGVDGDSASSTELYAILSSLSGVAVRQGLAVTGSVNQFGEVQAIGGANEKIEGFFEVCKARGLTGDQGVLIPASNVQDLMLHREVVAAARAGKFHVYPITTIQEGIELLTGVPAGVRLDEGGFSKNSIFARVEERLLVFAESDKDDSKDKERDDGAKRKRKPIGKKKPRRKKPVPKRPVPKKVGAKKKRAPKKNRRTVQKKKAAKKKTPRKKKGSVRRKRTTSGSRAN